MAKLDEFTNLFIGIDWGRVRDHTFIIIVELNDYGMLTVRHIKRFSNTPFETQIAYVNGLLGYHQIRACYVDATGMGMPLVEQLQAKHGGRVTGITFTNEIKAVMMQNLKMAFEKGNIQIPNHQELIMHLHSIQRRAETGIVKYEAPRTGNPTHHADSCWGLALAVHAALQNGGGARAWVARK